MKSIIKCFVILLFVSLSTKGQTIIDSLNASPNPFQSRTGVYFSFSQTDTVSINLYNVVGSNFTTLINVYVDSIMP